MSAQVPTKIVLKSTTKMSLNDRWECVPQMVDLDTRWSTGGLMVVCEGRGETWSPLEVPERFHPALFCTVATHLMYDESLMSQAFHRKLTTKGWHLEQADNHWFICKGIGEMWFLTKWEPFEFQHALLILLHGWPHHVGLGSSTTVKLVGGS